jgi:hypothetical protein
MRARGVALIASLALLVGGVSGFVYASLRSPEPSTVPAIEIDDEPSPDQQRPGGRRQGSGKKNERTRSGGPGGSGGSPADDPAGVRDGSGDAGESEGSGEAPGAQPVPPPPPAPAGTGDDDDDDEPEDDGDDDAAEADDST